MEYLDFEIEIAHGDRVEYPLAVIHSPAGETRATFTLPFSQIELENRILTLKNVLLRSGGQHRRARTPDELAVRDFGQDLFDALFTGDVGSLYHESRRQAERQDAGLRIKLRIQSPELSALPWEFLFDRRSDEFVCLSTATPLVRYLETSVPVRPLGVKPPLRVLGMVVSPNDLEPLDVATERERLDRALAPLQERGLVQLHWLKGDTWRDLQRCLRQEQWHIFHFVGHGAYDAERDEGIVAFADRQGRSRRLTAVELARLLTDHSTLRLALLNSCEGARAGQLDLLSSTAATLVRRGLPAVLAMQYDITDGAAIQLSESFYEALADGLPVDAALAEARKAISLGVANSLEWGTPALFMRSGDGRIFDIDPADAVGGAVAPAGLAATASMAQQSKAASMPDEGLDGADDDLTEATAASPAEQIRNNNQVTIEQPSIKKTQRRYASILLIFAAFLVIAAGFVAWRFLPFGGIGTPTATVGPTESRATDDIESRPVVVALATATGTATQTPTMTITPKPTPAITVTPTEPEAGTVREFGGIPFVYVPAGEFLMGSTDDDTQAGRDEKPQRRVYLDAYWIMQTEVTNAQYGKCVAVGDCREPNNDIWKENDYALHPASDVSWDDAVSYASWLSGELSQSVRLSTEAEWEKAARGADGRIYPWGDEWDPSRANYCDSNCEFYWKDEQGDDGYGRTAPAGSYADGASPYGALDMAGNVWEWTSDWYDDEYYAAGPNRNPSGPASGDIRLVRGGAWVNPPRDLRAADRYGHGPADRHNNLGLRLVVSSPGL